MMCLGDEDTKERPENPETLALQTTVSNLEKGCKYQQKAMYKRVFLFQCYIKKNNEFVVFAEKGYFEFFRVTI